MKEEKTEQKEFLPTKGLSEEILSPSSTLRQVIKSESDWIPEDEILPKLTIYVKLLYLELGRRRPLGDGIRWK